MSPCPPHQYICTGCFSCQIHHEGGIMVNGKRTFYFQGDTLAECVCHPPQAGCDCCACRSVACSPLDWCLYPFFFTKTSSKTDSLSPCSIPTQSSPNVWSQEVCQWYLQDVSRQWIQQGSSLQTLRYCYSGFLFLTSHCFDLHLSTSHCFDHHILSSHCLIILACPNIHEHHPGAQGCSSPHWPPALERFCGSRVEDQHKIEAV